jgi:hypothetical protein
VAVLKVMIPADIRDADIQILIELHPLIISHPDFDLGY